MTDLPSTDNFGRIVTLSSDGITDVYTVTDASDNSIVVEFPTGTDWTVTFNTINAMAPSDHVVPVAVPQRITRWQAYSQMLATPSFINPSPATLFSDVQAIVTATGGVLQLAWENQGFMYRHGSFILRLATSLGLTSDILDKLFIAAASLPE